MIKKRSYLSAAQQQYDDKKAQLSKCGAAAIRRLKHDAAVVPTAKA